MVIPAAIRRKYGIKSQTKVELLDLGNEVVLVPLPGRLPASSKGILKGVSTSNLIRARRQTRRKEHSG